MALAHKFQRMLDEGAVGSMADIARLGHVTRARVTQAMDLLLLAPDIQEELLHLPPVEQGRHRIWLRVSCNGRRASRRLRATSSGCRAYVDGGALSGSRF